MGISILPVVEDGEWQRKLTYRYKLWWCNPGVSILIQFCLCELEKEKGRGRLHLIIPVTNPRHSAACYPWTTCPTVTTTDVTVAITSTVTMVTGNHTDKKAFV